mmetsp:Transcript_13863/g.33581  ORF Transcript_13863/g.33581 Transcript_13863/m.33581 type:complete len:85 (-) Transcript_13863:794-1048(-)
MQHNQQINTIFRIFLGKSTSEAKALNRQLCTIDTLKKRFPRKTIQQNVSSHNVFDATPILKYTRETFNCSSHWDQPQILPNPRG